MDPIFHFRLRDLEAIKPWRRHEDGTAWLSWFGLTDGWSWMNLAGQEIGRLRPEVAPDPALPFVDYQVVRLWEDVLELMRFALEPVPDDVAAAMGPDPFAWQEHARRVFYDEVLPMPWGIEREVLEHGLEWWHRRGLSGGHTTCRARVWCWRVQDRVRWLWTTDDGPSNDYVEVRGTLETTIDELIAELERFDRSFLLAMEERCRVLVDRGGLDNIAIDFDGLMAEQRDRSGWLPRAMRRAQLRQTNWDRVRVALELFPLE